MYPIEKLLKIVDVLFIHAEIQVYKKNPVSIVLHSNDMTVSISRLCALPGEKREHVSTKCEIELKIRIELNEKKFRVNDD